MFGDLMISLSSMSFLLVQVCFEAGRADAEDASRTYMVGAGAGNLVVRWRATHNKPPSIVSKQLWDYIYHVDEEKRVSLFRDGRSRGCFFASAGG